MELILDKINIALIITGLLNLYLGIIIYTKSNKKINKIYAWDVFAIVSWTIAMILFRSSAQESALFWCIILYIAPTFIASTFLYFTYLFPTQIEKNIKKKKLIIFTINIILVILIAIPGLIIKGVNIRSGQEKEIIFGFLYFIYFLYIAGYFTYGFIRLYKKFLKTRSIKKMQIIYLLAGYIVGANLAFVTNLTMPWLGYFYLNWLGQIASLFLVICTCYAIIRYRLMDIKIATRNYLFYILYIAIIFILTIVLKYAYLSMGLDSYHWSFCLMMITFIALTINLANIIYFKFVNKYIFTSLYSTSKIIGKINTNINSTLDIKKIYHYIYEILEETMSPKVNAIFFYDYKKKEYIMQDNNGFTFDKKIKIKKQDIFYYHEAFIKKNRIVINEEVKNNPKLKTIAQASIKTLDKFNIALLTPLKTKNKIIGLMALGDKNTRGMYNSIDIRVLKVIGNQLAMVIENSRLYEETKEQKQAIQDFSKNLEKKVLDQTKDIQEKSKSLKETNKKLQKSLSLKTEILGTAAHQLRTPMTRIINMLDLLRDDTVTEEKEVKKYITDSFIETQGLIRIVNDFLTAAKLKTDVKQERILQMSVNLNEQLIKAQYDHRMLAERKKIKLSLTLPKKKLPIIIADPQNIAHALSNLVNNAVNYTSEGEVNISADQDKEFIYIKISDTGIGIPEKTQKNLFQQFVRAENANDGHADGSGLGLYIAKKMIEAHPKGKLYLESSQLNKGSVFVIKLKV